MLRYIAKTQPKGLKPFRNSSRPFAIVVASGVRRAGCQFLTLSISWIYFQTWPKSLV